jgi:methyl-accepting chemotaxis protein
MKALLAPGTALVNLFSVPRRIALIAAIFNVLFVVLAWLLIAKGGRAWYDPYILAAAAVLVFADYQQLGHYLVVKPGFGELADSIQRLSKGDLRRRPDVPVTGNRELQVLVNELDVVGANLAAMFVEVRSSAEEIGVEASQISDGHTDLSQRTDEQASTLEETAAGMEQLASTVRQNASNCERADQLAQQADTVASRGAQTVHRAVERMALIDKGSQRIVDIIGVIEGIAFQTNILALNAAVEAARAGDEGRGFAVVASEVRSLAQRAASAAGEIKVLIEDSAANVAEGGKLVGEAGATINEIVSGVRAVKELIAEVARASKEQSHGVDAINKAFAQMEVVTRQNAALVEQASSATQAFEVSSKRLAEAVGRFQFG